SKQGKRKVCAYHSTAAPPASGSAPGRTNFGVRAIDISDPAKPSTTAYLTTASMLDPWESLKANQRRQLLAAVHQPFPDFDIYDVGGDCRYPQLLASVVLQAPDGDPLHRIFGHEGSWAPDGMTYYGGDISYRNVFFGPDVSNPPPSNLSSGQVYAIDT